MHDIYSYISYMHKYLNHLLALLLLSGSVLCNHSVYSFSSANITGNFTVWWCRDSLFHWLYRLDDNGEEVSVTKALTAMHHLIYLCSWFMYGVCSVVFTGKRSGGCRSVHLHLVVVASF